MGKDISNKVHNAGAKHVSKDLNISMKPFNTYNVVVNKCTCQIFFVNIFAHSLSQNGNWVDSIIYAHVNIIYYM